LSGGKVDHDLKELHRRAVEFFGTRVTAIRDDQWDLPTPCSDWDVRELVRHLVYEALWTAPLMRGATLEEVGDRFEGDILGDDPKEAWTEAMRESLAAVEEVDLDRQVHLSRGPTPASHYAIELFSDHLIHGWDLSRAIGVDERLDEDMVRFAYDALKPFEDGLKISGMYGPKVVPPEGADLQTKLLAVAGREA
jgi:uncharacterized protein (TIGR03086 family)